MRHPDLSPYLERLIAVMKGCEPNAIHQTTDEEWDAALADAEGALQSYRAARGAAS